MEWIRAVLWIRIRSDLDYFLADLQIGVQCMRIRIRTHFNVAKLYFFPENYDTYDAVEKDKTKQCKTGTAWKKSYNKIQIFQQ